MKTIQYTWTKLYITSPFPSVLKKEVFIWIQKCQQKSENIYNFIKKS